LLTALDRYARGIEWVLARKDFDKFWPVGLPEAGLAVGGTLVEAVERALSVGERRAPRNPTSTLLLFFFSAYGIRAAGWPRERRLAYARELLGLVAAGKSGFLLNDDGRHLLARPLLAPVDRGWAETGGDSASIPTLNAFCSTLWAYSEALYFCNHRLGTERHGPYPGAIPGRCLVVRSAFDLEPSRLWSELEEWPAVPARIDVVFECDAEEDVRFDLFANPLFRRPAAEVTHRAVVCARDRDGEIFWPGSGQVARWTEELQRTIAAVVPLVRAMGPAERALRLHRIMLEAAAVVGADREVLDAAWEPSVDRGRRLAGDAEDLLPFYDLRREWADVR